MSTPTDAQAAAERFAAERAPIRRGAAMPRTRRPAPVVEQYEDYDDGDDYDPAPVVVRRQRVAYAPARKGAVSTLLEWTFYAVLILSVSGFALWLQE